MKLELRPYQEDDVTKLINLPSAAILNEQRTGKTPTSLTLCSRRGFKKILIVCSGTMLYKWKKEFELWVGKPCIVLDGTPKTRKEKLEQWKDDMGLCITYDTLKLRNISENKKTGELLNIIKAKPDAIIVDEFHRARNPTTALAKALFKLSTIIPHKYALTGTPAYGQTIDIYSLIKFLYPNNIGTFTQFKQNHCVFKQQYTAYNGIINIPTGIKPESQERLQRFLNKIAVQRKQSDPDVMPWLPKKEAPTKIYLPKNEEQEQMIANLEIYFETDDIMVQNVLDRITRERQILNDPRLLIPTKKKSPKTEWIINYFKEYKDTPTIFFSRFTSYLEILQKELDKLDIKYDIIIGATTKLRRDELVGAFQEGKLNALFIQTDTGKEGLTLDRAEHLIFIDQYPPVGDNEQAIERITATTEEKASIPKKVTKLIMEDSFEECIEEVLEKRLTATEAFNNFKKYLKY